MKTSERHCRGERRRRRCTRALGALACCLGSLILQPCSADEPSHPNLRTRRKSAVGIATPTLDGNVWGVVSGEESCISNGRQCGGMGYTPPPGASKGSLVCCAGYVCLEQDAFFSGCVAADVAAAELEARKQLTSSPQTNITVKPPVAGEAHNYAQALYLSGLFYEAQRAGPLPSTNRIPWRQSSSLHDSGINGEDLTGGWYDSGGFIKYGLPMAWSTTVLTWGLLEYWSAYDASGETKHMLECIKWPLDYFMKAHTAPDEFYVQIGDQSDYTYWGPPEVMPLQRTAYRVTCDNPGTEPVAETAAALAAGYLVFKDSEPEYAKKLLTHAQQLYDFGRRCPGNYVREGRLYAAEPYYTSYTGYKDELAWASLWLFRATGDPLYLNAAKEIYPHCCAGPIYTAFTWDNKAPAVQLLMYKLTGDPKYSQDVSSFVNSWVGRQRTPRGLSFYTAAPNKYAASASLIALLAADLGLMPTSYRRFAKSQIHYILGGQDGPGEHTSYLVGYGPRYVTAPHHRASSCPSQQSNATCRCATEPNYYILYGALVGGPEIDDAYEDSCPDFQANEVCTHCNAAFTSAVAGLKHLAMRKLLP